MVLQNLNLFVHLKELDLLSFDYAHPTNKKKVFELNLPMLQSIWLSNVGIEKQTLDAPRLRKVKLERCFANLLNLVHVDSVEEVTTEDLANIEVKKLNNLKYLCIGYFRRFDSTFLAALEQLEEIPLEIGPYINNDNLRSDLSELFEQKQRYRRVDLKIFLGGWLLNGPDDPVTKFGFDYFSNEAISYLAAHPLRLANKIMSFFKFFILSRNRARHSRIGDQHCEAIPEFKPSHRTQTSLRRRTLSGLSEKLRQHHNS